MNLVSLLCLITPTPSAVADAPVVFHREEDRLRIEIEGRPFATYAWLDPSIKRPYFADVRSPRGLPVTRSLPPAAGIDATDHATMHPGLWLAFGDLGGADFWRNEGVVRFAGFVEDPVVDPEGGRFAVRNRYETGGRIICEEVCRIRIDVTPHGYLLDWRSEFSGPEPFAFGDQEEMGLGFRVATALIVANGGEITDSEGRRGEAQVWGQPSDWCDYAGEGGGILLMSDPGNFRRSWFHARAYGLLVANPFGRRAFAGGAPSRVVVDPGESLTLRFGVLIHDGDPDREAAYRDFLSNSHDASSR
jgi:hypothetical protein